MIQLARNVQESHLCIRLRAVAIPAAAIPVAAILVAVTQIAASSAIWCAVPTAIPTAACTTYTGKSVSTCKPIVGIFVRRSAIEVAWSWKDLAAWGDD